MVKLSHVVTSNGGRPRFRELMLLGVFTQERNREECSGSRMVKENEL